VIFWPVHLSEYVGGHWVLVVFYVREKNIFIIDSLSSPQTNTLLKKVYLEDRYIIILSALKQYATSPLFFQVLTKFVSKLASRNRTAAKWDMIYMTGVPQQKNGEKRFIRDCLCARPVLLMCFSCASYVLFIRFSCSSHVPCASHALLMCFSCAMNSCALFPFHRC
jgi:hypothetical protein